jgi:hypothetical protein
LHTHRHLLSNSSSRIPRHKHDNNLNRSPLPPPPPATSPTTGDYFDIDIKIQDLGPDKDSVRAEAIGEQHALIRYDKPANKLSVTNCSDPEESRIFVNNVKLMMGRSWPLKVGDTVSIAGYFFHVEAGRLCTCVVLLQVERS